MEEQPEVTVTDQPPPHHAGARKGQPKTPIPQDCPFCDYKSQHPPGLALHIKAQHPKHWRGNLGASLGTEPSRPWKRQDKPRRQYRVGQSRYEWLQGARRREKTPEEARVERRIYQAKRRAQFRARGLNTKGEPYVQPDHYTVKRMGKRKLGMSATAALRLPKKRRGGWARVPRGVEGRTCPVCSKQFTTRPNMTLHLRNVHERSITEFTGDPRTGRPPQKNGAVQPATTQAPAPKPKIHDVLGVNFCPRCGCNIRNVTAAVQFGDSP